MALRLYSLAEKLAEIDAAIVKVRTARQSPGSPDRHHYEVLKAIAADIRGRMELPRNNALGELERALVRMKEAPRPEPREYNTVMMIEVTKIVINKWPTLQQALEAFGETSCE